LIGNIEGRVVAHNLTPISSRVDHLCSQVFSVVGLFMAARDRVRKVPLHSFINWLNSLLLRDSSLMTHSSFQAVLSENTGTIAGSKPILYK
jgi:hypothetical protein